MNMKKILAAAVYVFSLILYPSAYALVDSTAVQRFAIIPSNPPGYALATGILPEVFCKDGKNNRKKNIWCSFTIFTNQRCSQGLNAQITVAPITNDHGGICATRGYMIETPALAYNTFKKGYDIYFHNAYTSFVTRGCSDKSVTMQWTIYCM